MVVPGTAERRITLNIVTALALGITAILFMIFGIVSIYKPSIIGRECYWIKRKFFYIPRYKISTNEYYHNQIKIVGLGVLIASIIMFIFTIAYVINPDVLNSVVGIC
ncbi:hypothetical protein CLHOM_30140 [Clostridium homopropionicum DSM 5847]|uniref:Uncharacterized protein n=1 Tax=Clostridium homopropionicum DSM 5847 TaxID=1121318 RepID=A0A0L6Z6Z6_9CLOT|nr:hypothetical protein CLHOM_30140 [Clostridium homopropionicum DSM 5847]SFG54146.1 hypothetical protein SAMN04488501_110151 [Clostridium homopropionicum]